MLHKYLYGVFVSVALFVCFFSPVQTRGINGGISCAACTIVVGLGEQLAQLRNESLVNSTISICNRLPSYAQTPCLLFANRLEPVFLNKELYDVITPDVICYAIGSCYKDPGRGYCHLFPRPIDNFKLTVKTLKHDIFSNAFPRTDVCKFPIIHDICEVFMRTLTTLAPVIDNDKDGFSVIKFARGSNWRGKDCRDWDNDTYPGRRPKNNDIEFDSNCNGIWGVDSTTGKSWEEILCNGTEERGLIYIGDSIGAHFHFPELWMNPLTFTTSSVENTTNDVLDELDWPELGFATGFANTTQPDLIQGLTDSIYLKLRRRNRCNHRDYQNLSQNGAASFDVPIHAAGVARNNSVDKPAIAFVAFMGNDVCNRFQDTVNCMTTPQEFKQNILKLLEILDGKLPIGSHVILIGLIDGDFIYPGMSKRIHPLGSLYKNIRYEDVYRWFTCMEIGPCTGWMTPNGTLRQITSKKSQELTAVLQDLALNSKYKHFTLHFVRNPIPTVLKKYGGPIWEYIDPIDSLHPNQKSQPLLADVLWNELLFNLPDVVLGPVNPNNAKIDELFGDQGGH